MQQLVQSPQQSVPWLRRQLIKLPSVDTKRIAPLLIDLDSAEFPVRERATRELLGLGMRVRAPLRAALRRGPRLEALRRVEQILEKLGSETCSPDDLRTLRIVEALELINNPETRQILRELAHGEPDAWLTLEAKASLERLAKSEPRP